jgi:hypothetical protein
MKHVFREMKLSLPFRSVCVHCKKSLNFDDRKYTDAGISSGYYCEECKNQLEIGKREGRN